MEENELIIDRENQINELCNNLLNIADGKDIIGDGKKLVRDAEFAKITHDFTDGIYIRKMDMKAGSVFNFSGNGQSLLIYVESKSFNPSDKDNDELKTLEMELSL